MKNKQLIIIALALFIMIDISFPRNAYAYLDPGTGSYLLQLLVAALLGAVVTAKIFWHRLKSFFKNLFSR